MEHILERSAPLRHFSNNSVEKIVFVTVLIWVSFNKMKLRIIEEVNDWALRYKVIHTTIFKICILIGISNRLFLFIYKYSMSVFIEK